MKHLKGDIVIFGAGSAGLAATVAAAEKGVSVISLEKASVTGGTGNFAHGPLAIESRLQKSKGINFTVEEAFKIHMEFTHWQVDAGLVRTYYEKTASTIDWLMEKGVEFADIADHGAGNKLVWHRVKSPEGMRGPAGSAAVMMKILTEKAKEYGAQILLKTPVKSISRKDKTNAEVIAENENGETVQINTRAIIIATGGFLGNGELVKKYTGLILDQEVFPVRKNRNLSGDGIRMAWEAGAAPTMMTLHMAHGIPDLEFMPLFQHPDLVVNLDGDRFVNEEVTGNTTFFGNAISRQPQKLAFMILDENCKEYYQSLGEGPFGKVDYSAEIQKALDKLNPHIFVLNSVEEIAEKTGINLEGLKKTLNEYNKACETGRDDLFFKNPKYLKPVKKPPFYVARMFPFALGTLGGIKVNYRMEVLDRDNKVIPGLYAAGLDANSLYADSYPWIMSGNTFGFAINSGRMAAENAVEYVRGL